jgi:hypothetical protein
MSRNSRAFLLAVALLAASLVAAPASNAASSKRCKALAGKAKVIVKGKDEQVVSRGRESALTLTYYACLYTKPRLWKIPDQNGGDTELFNTFTSQGRYLAYGHVNAEEASPFTPSWIDLVDLKRRKRIFQHDAFPIGPMDEESTGVTQILLRADGAVAWIAYALGSPDNYSVQTVLPAQAKPAEVDRGEDVGKTSLRRVADNPDAFSWTRAGVRKEAVDGGPTVVAP